MLKSRAARLISAVAFAGTLACFPAYAQDAAASADSAECIPLKEQYPDLGTPQSVSASRDFVTVWASFDLPGGPCGYSSAQEHYDALLADAKSRGGPTQHTFDTLPDWSGHWGTENNTGEVAIVGRSSFTEGMAVRLKPEAREVFLRDAEMWKQNHAIDPLSFCLPPNYPRWHTEYGYREHFLTPEKALLGSEMMNQFRRIFTDGRPLPSEEWMTKEWLGYSIGFWDGDILTVLTKGIREGILQRNMPRQSDQMEVVERWRMVEVPEGVEIKAHSAGPGNFTPQPGDLRMEIEITMYDPNFVEPWHTVAAYYKEDESTPELKEIVWPHQWDCEEGSNWFINAEGVVSQYAPGEKPDITNPDMWFDERYVHQ